MTDDLIKPTWLHKTGVLRGFSKQYGIKMLVWYEQHDTRVGALTRERQMKKWNRAWKIELIEKMNSSWSDLYEGLAS
jgi:putative endonuclease